MPFSSPRFTISKETTYVTGPLTDDGYIDYAAAINLRGRAEVVPGENANIWFWRAMGPTPEGGRPMPEEFFRLMGMEVLPIDGRYYESLVQNARRRAGGDLPAERLDALNEQWMKAMERPWTAEQHPELAAWLSDNEAQLAVAVEGTRRGAYTYIPKPFTADELVTLVEPECEPVVLREGIVTQISRQRELVLLLV